MLELPAGETERNSTALTMTIKATITMIVLVEFILMDFDVEAPQLGQVSAFSSLISAPHFLHFILLLIQMKVYKSTYNNLKSGISHTNSIILKFPLKFNISITISRKIIIAEINMRKLFMLLFSHNPLWLS